MTTRDGAATEAPRAASTASSRPPSIVLVTDPRWPMARVERVIEVAGAAVGPGALAVQLRDKEAAPAALAVTARALRAVAARAGAWLVVNAPGEEERRVAADAGADGVHVPCRAAAIADARAQLGDGAWITTPAHADEDVSVAVAAGATGALVSPVFDTPRKGPPRGVAALRAARARSGSLLVYALGGVDGSRAASCAAAGAHGVAVMRALLDAFDVAAVARVLDAPFRGSGVHAG